MTDFIKGGVVRCFPEPSLLRIGLKYPCVMVLDHLVEVHGIKTATHIEEIVELDNRSQASRLLLSEKAVMFENEGGKAHVLVRVPDIVGICGRNDSHFSMSRP